MVVRLLLLHYKSFRFVISFPGAAISGGKKLVVLQSRRDNYDSRWHENHTIPNSSEEIVWQKRELFFSRLVVGVSSNFLRAEGTEPG